MTGDEELSGIKEVLESGFLTQGPKATQFENLVKEYVGVKHAFAVSSATTGLHLGLIALGVEPGDEVIIPDFSFPATANAVVQTGAIPIFVDIEPDTFNLDPTKLEAAITEKTTAIMPVHAFGLPANMDAINAIAAKFSIPVIEDAACALSGQVNGKQAGGLADLGVFSWHPRKIITTGEGGMILTDRDDLAERIAVLRTHGAVRGEFFMEFVDAGFNYRLSDVHSAIGIAQMAKLDHIVARRAQLASEMDAALAGIPGVTVPAVPAAMTHAYQSYVVTLDESINRNQVITNLKALDIESTLGTYGLHLQPYFRERFNLPDEAFPNATRAHNQALTLPLYPQLTSDDVALIAERLATAVASA
jgi:dTDP-4-amino-4,6-dideoxygalactose transaminase